ncbi:hypothetical protein AMECASPLE_035392, partial [Ameca splendens]
NYISNKLFFFSHSSSALLNSQTSTKSKEKIKNTGSPKKVKTLKVESLEPVSSSRDCIHQLFHFV